MYERFTDRARKVMQLANQEAQRFGHEYIGTEHMLLGLIKDGSAGVAHNVLAKLGVTLANIRAEVEKIVQRAPNSDQVVLGKLPHTPRAKQAIEQSVAAARELNHNYVGTEHLLLGIIRVEEGIANQVLKNLGISLESVRAAIISVLGTGAGDDKTPNPPPGHPWHLDSGPARYIPVGSLTGLSPDARKILDQMQAIINNAREGQKSLAGEVMEGANWFMQAGGAAPGITNAVAKAMSEATPEECAKMLGMGMKERSLAEHHRKNAEAVKAFGEKFEAKAYRGHVVIPAAAFDVTHTETPIRNSNGELCYTFHVVKYCVPPVAKPEPVCLACATGGGLHKTDCKMLRENAGMPEMASVEPPANKVEDMGNFSINWEFGPLQAVEGVDLAWSDLASKIPQADDGDDCEPIVVDKPKGSP